MSVQATETAAADLPVGMMMDVRDVLRIHGLDPDPVELLLALARVIDATPVDRGGYKAPR